LISILFCQFSSLKTSIFSLGVKIPALLTTISIPPKFLTAIDTAIWTDEVLQNRAKAYGMSVKEYKTNNVLKTEIRSDNVAELVCAMAGDVFAKTTGSQVAIDGGSDRII